MGIELTDGKGFGPGRLRSAELARNDTALRLYYDTAWAEVSLDAAGTVRIRAGSGSEIAEDHSLAVVRDYPDWVRLQLSEDDFEITVRPRGKSPKRPGAFPGVVVVARKDAAVLHCRPDIRGRKRSKKVFENLWSVELIEFSGAGASRAALITGLGAHYWGFGEKTGPLDKRGLAYTMRTRDMPVTPRLDPLYASIPFFMWTRPAWRHPSVFSDVDDSATREAMYSTSGCLLECFAPAHFDIARSFEDRVIITTEGWGMDLTLFAGPTPKDVLRNYCAITGLPPMPPLWALGYHQSRWSYETEEKVFEVAGEFDRRNIPLDVIHLDIDYMDGYRVFTWDRRRFPDPRRMIEELAKKGIRIVTIVDPGIKVEKEFDVFREAMRRGVLCKRDDGSLFRMRVWPGNAAFCDFNLEEARSFWGELHERLYEIGVAGIWNDMNEPAGWRLDIRLSKLILPLLPQNTTRMRQADPTRPSERLIEHEAVRNIYAYQECRAVAEHREKTRPQERYFLLSRSGYAGIQRFAAMWTGDIASSWSHLDLSIRMILGLSLSGVGFCGADIGGFVGRPSRELYARWIQVGALYPFSRTHTQGIWGWQEPYSFGRQVESIARSYISLRMRLLAYIYGLFAEYNREGIPPWRTVFLEHPEEPMAYSVENEVLLGRHLLIAPVTQKGGRSRTVFFPPGEWLPLGSDLRCIDSRSHIGPRHETVSAPLEWMPVFVRAGAVVPALDPARNTAEILRDAKLGENGEGRTLVFKAFLHSPSYLASRCPGGEVTESSRYYEDDFESTAYKDGRFALYDIEMCERIQEDGSLALRIKVSESHGGYSPRLQPTLWEIYCPGGYEPEEIEFDGEKVEWDWDGALGVATIRRPGPIGPLEIAAVLRERREPPGA